ncbi:MAG TPA: MmcQ/YjbR family DNA-binding protein [Vicinamibacterales bacterium]|jgi:predicted DNA-binding protein (MmcQ/YjbR family)
MTIEGVRKICRAWPGVTEDVKWGADLVFSVGGKMFAVVCLEPPHTLAFKCTPDEFAELIERPGIIPAPYLARAMWVQEQGLGEALERPEVATRLRASYELVAAKLPRSKQPGRPAKAKPKPRAKRKK